MTLAETIPARQARAIDVDPYDDATLADPLAMYAAVREAGPVAWLSRYGVHVMGRYKPIRAVLEDWSTFSSTGGSGLADIRKPGAWRAPSPIVEVDPPRHTHVRQVMQRILSPALIRAWREAFEREAEAQVARLLDIGTFDGVADLAEAYVATTFPEALGLPFSPERRDNLFLLGALNFDGQGPRNARYEATQKRADAIQDWYLAMMERENLAPDGFGAKIFAAADAGQIEPETAPLLIRSFLRGGLDSTTSAISAALHHLAENPDQWKLFREDSTKARAAFEEAMRLETPIQNVCRLTMGAVEIDGVHVPADEKILILLGSANRDPDQWARPDSYDLTRVNLGQMALGHGIHMCVGQMIARLEGEAVLKALARQVATIEPAGVPTRRLNNNLRSLASLPLRITAA